MLWSVARTSAWSRRRVRDMHDRGMFRVPSTILEHEGLGGAQARRHVPKYGRLGHRVPSGTAFWPRPRPLAELWGSKLKPFFRLLGFICLAVATGLMSANEDISGHDAFYFLMTTMTTVGFGDIAPKKGKTRVLVGLGLMFILLASTIPPSLSTNTGGGAMQYGHV